MNGCYVEDGGSLSGEGIVFINSLVGDVNCDTAVDILDITIMVNMILPGGGEQPTISADVNGDGIVNVLDIMTVVTIILNP